MLSLGTGWLLGDTVPRIDHLIERFHSSGVIDKENVASVTVIRWIDVCVA